jgi:hypothetical protein
MIARRMAELNAEGEGSGMEVIRPAGQVLLLSCKRELQDNE